MKETIFRLLSSLSVTPLKERVVRFIADLSPRDRILFIGLVSFFILLGVAFSVRSAARSLSAIRRENAVLEKAIATITSGEKEFRALEREVSRAEREITNNVAFSLSAVLEKVAGEAGLREAVDSIVEREKTVAGPYEEEGVEVKLRRVTLRPLVEMLYAIETFRPKLRIRSLKIRTRFEGKGFLDVSMEVAFPKPKGGSS